MSDYSTAAASALTSLNSATDGGMVEEYEIAPSRRRVKRGKAVDQIQGALLLEALAARRSSGLFNLAKRVHPE